MKDLFRQIINLTGTLFFVPSMDALDGFSVYII